MVYCMNGNTHKTEQELIVRGTRSNRVAYSLCKGWMLAIPGVSRQGRLLRYQFQKENTESTPSCLVCIERNHWERHASRPHLSRPELRESGSLAESNCRSKHHGKQQECRSGQCRKNSLCKRSPIRPFIREAAVLLSLSVRENKKTSKEVERVASFGRGLEVNPVLV